MPPKRKRPARAPDPQPRPPPSLSPASDVEMEDASEPPPSFFNISFTTHRASPLFIGDEDLSPARLATLAQRLRDTLVGDVVRGVQVGLEGSDASLGRAGSLERVTIRWFDTNTLLGDEGGGTSRRAQIKGLSFEMRYENTLCTALLLPRSLGRKEKDKGKKEKNKDDLLKGPFGADNDDDDPFAVPNTFDQAPVDDGASPGFLALPLLLTRMPTQLRAFVLDFISRTFDCRISPLCLGTRSLITTWERWVDDAGLPSRGPLAKDLVLTLGFHLPPPRDAPDEEPPKLGLRTIDVIIPPDDAGRFLRAEVGEGAAKKQGWEDDLRMRSWLSGGGTEEGWAWAGEDVALPFTRALAFYMDRHLALNLFHPSVQVTRIACGGFALAENRLKVFAVASGDEELAATVAVKGLVGGLIDKAAA